MGLDSDGLDRMRRLLRHRLLNIASAVKSSNMLLASELDDRLSAREREYFPLIQKECDQISELVERVDAACGQLPASAFFPVALTISSLMNEICSKHPMAEITVEVDVADPGREICMSTLKVLLEEVVSNAYEISRKPVTVSVGDHVTGCLIQVFDQGEALPAAGCEMAFEPFYTTRTRHLGVGLSIVKRMVLSQGGTVSIAPGLAGNVFTCLLPYRN